MEVERLVLIEDTGLDIAGESDKESIFSNHSGEESNFLIFVLQFFFEFCFKALFIIRFLFESLFFLLLLRQFRSH